MVNQIYSTYWTNLSGWNHHVNTVTAILLTVGRNGHCIFNLFGKYRQICSFNISMRSETNNGDRIPVNGPIGSLLIATLSPIN